MGLFSSEKKNISKREWEKKVRPALRAKGMLSERISGLEGLFWSDMNETRAEDRGIDKEEFDTQMEWLEINKNREGGRLTERDLATIQEVLGKYF